SNTLSKDTVGAALYANRTDESVSGDTDLLFKTSAGSTMNTHMIIKSDGNVGIGTTEPGAKLHTKGDLVIFEDTNSGTAVKIKPASLNTPEITFHASDDSKRFSVIADMESTTDDDVLKFQEEGNDVLAITGTGNVGIGTAEPGAKLHIYKASAGSYYDQYATALIEDEDGRLQILATDSGSNGAGLILTNNKKSWGIHQKTATGGSNRLDIGYRESSASEDILGAQSVKMSILTNGNVGIGTTSPGYKLEVNGQAKVGNQVGIGTNPTTATLTLKALGNAYHGLAIVRNSASGRSQISLQDESGSEIWRFGLTGGGSTDFNFYDGTQNALTLEQGGDILMNPAGNVGQEEEVQILISMMELKMLLHLNRVVIY
ncbi:MAG: hypothetical protein ACTSPB_26900, partial [Candidatus Thorarchaeota archaeon]